MVNGKPNNMKKEYKPGKPGCACNTKSNVAKARSALAGYLLHPFLPSPMLASVDVTICKKNPTFLLTASAALSSSMLDWSGVAV